MQSALIFLSLLLLAIQTALSFQPIFTCHRSSSSSSSYQRKSSEVNMSSGPIEIKTDGAPKPLGPYSQAVKAGNTIYCSGNIAIDPKTNEIVGNGNVKEETRKFRLTITDSG